MAYWNVFCNNYYKKSGVTVFNLLPTIEYTSDKAFEKIWGLRFDISIRWLFWYITISRYSGDKCENKNKTK